MKNITTLLATAALIGLASPAFAQVTLLTAPSTTQSQVTTSIQPACAITNSLSSFLVQVTANGVATAPAPQSLTVTCNTPDGNIEIGSDDMVNEDAPDIVETGTFTDTIKFIGQANGLTGGDAWMVDSRSATGFASAATVGFNTNRRVRSLSVSVETIAPEDGKLLVAGNYAGEICITVTPLGSLFGSALQNNNTTCSSGDD